MFSYIDPKDGPVIAGEETHEVVYAKDQPEYKPLRTLIGSGNECPVMSRWSPTDEQRKAIAAGADIYLTLWTFGNPLQPILLAIGDGTESAPFGIRQRGQNGQV